MLLEQSSTLLLVTLDREHLNLIGHQPHRPCGAIGEPTWTAVGGGMDTHKVRSLSSAGVEGEVAAGYSRAFALASGTG